ncbi:MAG TPA: hypothetical protein PKU97_01120 [Kofleriaceae bacterium]|nr:hypothetical protein [Kofleriaceae bacterium]
MASSRSGSSLWTAAWLRAVAGPAGRRAGAVWASLAVVAAVVMGPTALTPPSVVALLTSSPGAAALLGGLWLALLHPAARILVRAEAASFLRSLPSPPLGSALPGATLALLHAPVPALMGAGGAPRAALLAWAGVTALSATLTLLPWPQRRRAQVAWRSAGQGLRQILWQRLWSDDALLRAAAFAGLAGLAAHLMIHNNQLFGPSASTLGLGTVALLGAPAWAAVIQPLAVVHRRLWPLCASAGVAHTSYVAALAVVQSAAMIALCALASLLATWGLPIGDVLRMLAGAVVLGLALGLAAVPVARWATQSATVAARVLTGTLACSASAVLLLGLWAETGLAAALAIAVAALLRIQEPVLC